MRKVNQGNHARFCELLVKTAGILAVFGLSGLVQVAVVGASGSAFHLFE